MKTQPQINLLNILLDFCFQLCIYRLKKLTDKINEVLKEAKFQKDIVWQPPLTEDETLNGKAKDFIKENGVELERIMGRKIQTK